MTDIKVATQLTTRPHNPPGVKGCSDAGAIAAPAALFNAISDAIGNADFALPATPETVWRALQAGRQGE